MAFFGKLHEQYAELWKAIIRPPRDQYELSELGPATFSIKDKTYQRSDLTLRNPRGQNIACSHFEPIPSQRAAEQLPCVVYLHGNCSSRCEAVQCLPVLLPFGITVFCLDFSGSGMSDGEYISLGFYERDDLATVVDHLRETNKVTCIGLWGRSMGAATALLHADRDPSIAGLVLDSPFSDLRVLCQELVDTFTDGKVPHWLVGVALAAVRMSIQNEAEFDINDLAPIQHVSNSFIPACFVAANMDNFIKPHHTKELHEAYAGDKNIVMVDGDHNSPRGSFFMDSVAIFFHNTLQCETIPNLRSPPAARVAAPSLRQSGRRSASGSDHAGRGRQAPQALGLQMQAPGRLVADELEAARAMEEEMVQQAIQLSLQEGSTTAPERVAT
jgi:pimeloyl-ACP methyl ester carboxylesterase